MTALLAALPDTEPRRYLYDLVPLYPKRAGKGLRCGLLWRPAAPSAALPP